MYEYGYVVRVRNWSTFPARGEVLNVNLALEDRPKRPVPPCDVIPANAGIQSFAGFLDPRFRDCRKSPARAPIVIPAHAGIQSFQTLLDPRFHGDDKKNDFSDSLFRGGDRRSHFPA